MSSYWVADAESSIFTYLRKKTLDDLKTKYPSLYFTREENNDDLTTNVYPTCYIKFNSMEIGNTLVDNGINAINLTMTVDVTSSKTQGIEGARTVIYAVLDHAKELQFQVKMMPEIMTVKSDIRRMVMRLSRVIGYNDKIIK